MRIELMAFDMDGTLLRSDGTLSQRVIDSLKRAQAAGARVALASGRMPCATRSFAEALDLRTPTINYNGALIADALTGEELASTPVGVEVARELCAFAEGMGMYIQWYEGDTYIAENYTAESELYERALKGVVRFVKAGGPLSKTLDRPTPKLIAIGEPARMTEALPLYRERFAGRLNCAISQPRYIEFTHPEADKGTGLKKLCGITGVPLSRTAAFGDSLNDMEMLEVAGVSYAMGNARPEIKARCQRVAPSNDDDGVAVAVDELIARNFEA